MPRPSTYLYGLLRQNLMNIPTALEDHRKELGLSRRRAAHEIGISATTYGNLVRGANVTTEHLLRALTWLVGDRAVSDATTLLPAVQS
jgi:DNA-binding XRE family transcriptional regulator